MSEPHELRPQYTLKFPQSASVNLDEMAVEEGVSVSELIRRAINFYQVKMTATANNRIIVMRTEDGTHEWVILQGDELNGRNNV